MNKRGIIKIIEAFIAVLLVAGVLLFVVSKNSSVLETRQERIEEIQKSILQDISQNNDYRNAILGITAEQELSQTSAGKLGEIWLSVDNQIPDELEFKIKICVLENICSITVYPEKDVYTKSVAITSNIAIYRPKQFKIWTWEK
ncbi:MAG: hypothetical protein AABY22_32185 [Nanoarchaeota archaeon]